ncbi:MAG: DASS family sodium-coupled anion symporter [Planctomycetota bacterium]|nr:DASS family sodium-coupled anion symporter [Planctomycetota bacterium]MCX8039389.1 DASS family sodium-coupled anion symporter [Planctomycetota bacterium]MDW8372126.1 DASS family sodium-coupled anion symporter [Planctomycetota bacterium]
MSHALRLLIAIGIPLLVWAIPTEALPIAGLTVIGHRALVLFLLAMLLWILEPIAVFATSLAVTLLALLLLSDGGIAALVTPPADAAAAAAFGKPLSHRELMATFADPVIKLLLGGFFLAAAAAKYGLDRNLARVLLRPFGTRPALVLLGLMLTSAAFSLFMSNTACTAMMLTVLAPVLAALPAGDRGRIALVLAVPFAANIGGIGTPIGTPPNAVAMRFLTGEHAIGFASWMLFGIPYVLVLLLIAWGLLLLLFRPQAPQIAVNIGGSWDRSWRAWVVYAVFALTIALWVSEAWHGVRAPIVALLPVAVFLATGVLGPADLRGLSWDVLWLVAGGFALSLAVERSGLAAALVASVPFAELPLWAVALLAVGSTTLLGTFISNTATANLLLPVVAGVAAALGPALAPLGGYSGLILAVTFAASLAMILPISTPPNALAYATGEVRSAQMALAGSLICVIGLALAFALFALLRAVGFFA